MNTEKTETGTDVSRCVQETAAIHPIYSDKAHQKSMKSALFLVENIFYIE